MKTMFVCLLAVFACFIFQSASLYRSERLIEKQYELITVQETYIELLESNCK